MAIPMPVLPPLSPSFYLARRNGYSSFQAVVAEVRRNPDPHAPDLLNCCLARGTPLSDAALAEALATNFFGGVFSCSSTVNTALYLLAKHPEEQGRVVRAVREALPPDFDRAALDACRPLEYANREAMRYYPAVPIYFRNSAPDRDVARGPHALPPNTPIFISNWYMHKFAPHLHEPETFNPTRWADGAPRRTRMSAVTFSRSGAARGPVSARPSASSSTGSFSPRSTASVNRR
jgi:cytochrome P450